MPIAISFQARSFIKLFEIDSNALAAVYKNFSKHAGQWTEMNGYDWEDSVQEVDHSSLPVVHAEWANIIKGYGNFNAVCDEAGAYRLPTVPAPDPIHFVYDCYWKRFPTQLGSMLTRVRRFFSFFVAR